MARNLTDEEILAYTLLGEAANQGDEGMAAVMHVIKNRAESGSYPANLASVALQHSKGGVYQFTTWSPKDGNNPSARYSTSSAAYKRALAVVRSVVSGESADPTEGALNYYANSGGAAIKKPSWFDRAAVTGGIQIGDHIFASRTAAVPKTMSPATQVARNGPVVAAAIRKANFLPASTEQLQAVVGRNPAITTPQGPQGRGRGGTLTGDSGLVTRKVTTVAINPLTGMPAATSPNVKIAAAKWPGRL